MFRGAQPMLQVSTDEADCNALSLSLWRCCCLDKTGYSRKTGARVATQTQLLAD
jgi:hypothetical protein